MVLIHASNNAQQRERERDMRQDDPIRKWMEQQKMLTTTLQCASIQNYDKKCKTVSLATIQIRSKSKYAMW